MSSRINGLWPLVGRENQVEEFIDVLGNPAFQNFIICGPAGVGKSRLSRELLQIAGKRERIHGVAVATAAAGTVPFGAIAHLLPPQNEAEPPMQVFRRTVEFLRASGRRRSIILVDDAHLLDVSSITLLHQLMDSGDIFLMATCRSDGPRTHAVAALDRGDRTCRVELPHLNRSTVGELLKGVLGGPVEGSLIHRLYTQSGGNPLFLRELLLGARQSGALVNDGVWRLVDEPSGTVRLSEILRERIAVAGKSGLEILQLLSVCGPVGMAELDMELLDHLEETGLVKVENSGRRSIVSLAHPLHGELLRSDITESKRQSLLLRRVEEVSSFGARRREDSLNMAIWRLQATGTAEPQLLIQAARLARHAEDYRQVATLARASLRAEESSEARLLLGQSLHALGRFEEAEQVLRNAYGGNVATEEKVHIVLHRAENLFWGMARPDDAMECIQKVKETAQQRSTQAALSSVEGTMRVYSGESRTGLSLIEENARYVDDPWVCCFASIGRITALTLGGNTTEAFEVANRECCVRESVTAPGCPDFPFTMLRSFILSEAGRIDEARSVCLDGYTRAVESRSLVAQIWLAVHAGRIDWLAGRPASCRRWSLEAAALARARSFVAPLQRALSQVAASAALLGDSAASQDAINEMETLNGLPFLAPEKHLGRAWLYACTGDLRAAQELLQQAASEARETQHTTSESQLLCDVARLGGASDVTERLCDIARTSSSALVRSRALFSQALHNQDAEGLGNVSKELSRLGAGLLAAEAATAAATVLRRSGSTRRATSWQNTAAGYRAKCQGAHTPGLVGLQEPHPLTVREREIALLAISGASSKEIAERLVLSVRTVDNHLLRVYAKMGVTGRKQLAAVMKGR
jgi:DNA-binding CsgD family transcriptional regulator/tetratricopeptide (TPR) repeat protein